MSKSLICLLITPFRQFWKANRFLVVNSVRRFRSLVTEWQTVKTGLCGDVLTVFIQLSRALLRTSQWEVLRRSHIFSLFKELILDVAMRILVCRLNVSVERPFSKYYNSRYWSRSNDLRGMCLIHQWDQYCCTILPFMKALILRTVSLKYNFCW